MDVWGAEVLLQHISIFIFHNYQILKKACNHDTLPTRLSSGWIILYEIQIYYYWRTPFSLYKKNLCTIFNLFPGKGEEYIMWNSLKVHEMAAQRDDYDWYQIVNQQYGNIPAWFLMG